MVPECYIITYANAGYNQVYDFYDLLAMIFHGVDDLEFLPGNNHCGPLNRRQRSRPYRFFKKVR